MNFKPFYLLSAKMLPGPGLESAAEFSYPPFGSFITTRPAQSDSQDRMAVHGRAMTQSEGCEFDPRGGLVHDLLHLFCAGDN